MLKTRKKNSACNNLKNDNQHIIRHEIPIIKENYELS